MLRYETVSDIPDKYVDPVMEKFTQQFGEIRICKMSTPGLVEANSSNVYYISRPDAEFYVYNASEGSWRKLSIDEPEMRLLVKDIGCPKCGQLNTSIMRGILNGKAGWTKCWSCTTTYHFDTREIHND